MKKLFQNITTERYNRKKISLFTIKISWFTKERYKIVFFLIQSLKLFIRLFVRQLQAEISLYSASVENMLVGKQFARNFGIDNEEEE